MDRRRREGTDGKTNGPNRLLTSHWGMHKPSNDTLTVVRNCLYDLKLIHTVTKGSSELSRSCQGVGEPCKDAQLP
jgi:hypothetical protein